MPMALFGRKSAAPKSPAVGVAAPLPRDRSSDDWAHEAVEAGRRARIAIESWNMKSARDAWKEKQYADARRKGYSGDDGFFGFDEQTVEFSRTFKEPETLGLPAERVAEVRTALALNQVLGDTEGRGVLAALLGTPFPVWEEFNKERDEWLSSGKHPEMWDDILSDGESYLPSQTARLSSLSHDARQVLAYTNVLQRRIAVARSLIAQRTLLPEDRLEEAMVELTAAGFAGTPTVQDQLMTLTVDQLKTALTVLGIAGRGNKGALAEALAGGDPEQLQGYMLANHPAAFATEWAVGLDADGTMRWLSSFAYLAWHWLTFSLSTTALIAIRGTKSPNILRTDDCVVCLHPTRSLPPFHIGCRCAWS
jgi:hypothetical protein